MRTRRFIAIVSALTVVVCAAAVPAYAKTAAKKPAPAPAPAPTPAPVVNTGPLDVTNFSVTVTNGAMSGALDLIVTGTDFCPPNI